MHEVRGKLDVPFQKWAKKFCTSGEGKAAIVELDTLRNRDPSRFNDLKNEILFACYCAASYKSYIHNQPINLLAKTKMASDSMFKYLESAHVVADLYHKNPELFVHSAQDAFTAIDTARSSLGISQPRLECRADTLPADKVGDYFHSLLVSYLVSMAHRAGGPMFLYPERTWIGCVDYGTNVRGHRRPVDEARSALAFELALRFKLWTVNPWQRDPLDVFNVTMPKDGYPRYALIAIILRGLFKRKTYRSKATWEDEASKVERDLTRFKHKYPSAKYVGWPLLMDP